MMPEPVTLGRYRLGVVLGAGSGTVTYRAEDTRLGRHVALKVAGPDAGPYTGDRAQLVEEARIAARVAHPHVAPLLDAGESDGVVYLAFQFAPDGDLRRLLERERRLDPARVVRLLGPIAGALDALHAQGIVHADVKPGNIVLTALGKPDERAVLVDFGTAVSISTTGSDDCAVAREATTDYAPPEQIRGEPIGARADVHALAAMIWECLAGAPPSAASSDAFGFWPPEPHGGLPRFDAVRPDLHVEVSDVLASGLADSASERPASAGALFAALAPALERGARPTLPVAASPMPSMAPGGARFRRRALLVSAGALAVGALAATSGFALPGRGSGALPRPAVTPRVRSSRAEHALRAAIPRAIRASCHAATAPRPALAVLTCTDGPVRVQYERYPTDAAMRVAFGTSTLAPLIDHADLCAQGLADEWTWRAGSKDVTPSGSYRCTVQPDGARLEWTTESLRTVSRAIRGDGDLRELHEWWSTAGPDASPAPITTTSSTAAATPTTTAGGAA